MQKSSPDKALKAQRRKQAMELRLSGLTYVQIGEVMGVSKQAAHHLVLAVLAATRRRTAEVAEDVRDLEVARLDALVGALWDKREDPRVADSILKTMERRAKLLGLDAASKSEVSLATVSDEELERRVGEIAAAARAREPGGAA